MNMAWFRTTVIGLFLVAWQLASGTLVDTFVISRPTDVFPAMVRQFTQQGLLWNLLITFEEALIGYVISVMVGILGAGAFIRFPFVDRAMYPILMAINGIPRVALAPLFLIWFGLGIPSKVAVVFSTVVFIVFMNTLTGLKEVDLKLVNILRSMGASEYHLFTKVRLPSALPYVFVGLRIGLPYAIVGAIIGEFLSATAGVGYQLQRAGTFLDTASVMAIIIVLAVLVLALNSLLSIVERRTFHWKPSEERISVAGPGM